MYKRLIMVSITFLLLFALLYMRTYVVMNNNEYLQAVHNQGTYTVTAGVINGNIYDYSFKLINNSTYEYIAAVNPTSEAVSEIITHVKDKDNFYSKLKFGNPFVCSVNTDKFVSDDITVFKVPVRTTEKQIAQHIIGYTQNGKGVSGLESSYNDLLRSVESKNQVTYYTDGMGEVLEGKSSEIKYADDITTGVVTTIDSQIQRVCENAAKDVEKGAVVVMDINTGEIRAMVSKPDYSINSLDSALENENSPLINRALYAYNVGSIFKLVTADEALNEGLSENYRYTCTGSIEICGQKFNCHNLSGHGSQDMKEAMINSCNTYFINLVQNIDTYKLWNTADVLGFGRETVLADSIVSSAGNLPTISELEVAAEKANFSFGQGKLLATPVQITSLTCAIANGGNLPIARLVRGNTVDGKTVENEKEHVFTKAITPEVAEKLRGFMTAVVNDSETSNAKPERVIAAGKTSTAQTGRYDENGVEICQAWITGFFPVSDPQYAVTVLVEDGGYGNTVAAPVFKKIADGIY